MRWVLSHVAAAERRDDRCLSAHGTFSGFIEILWLRPGGPWASELPPGMAV